MAGKGGGSWKVAYADFVTAMMAFFLVMWIGSQDQKTRQSVANYFIDPSGVSKRPVRTGAVFDSITYGSVPKSESVAMGRGRNSHSSPGDASAPTKRVNDWLQNDQQALNYWKSQAQAHRDAAAKAKEVKDGVLTVNELAIAKLSRQMKAEVQRTGSTSTAGLQQELLSHVISEVNWNEIAEDLIKE